MDALICGAAVGTFFQLAEDLVYSSGGLIVALFRGVTPYHFLFGAIMGYYYGKSVVSGRNSDKAKALLVPTLLHGLFDFSFLCLKNDEKYFPFAAIVFVLMCVLTALCFYKIFRWSKDGTLSDPFPLK